MLGISRPKFCCSILSTILLMFCVTSLAHGNVATNDLLVGEQWALENRPADTTQASSSLEPRGTCASSPAIGGNGYTCDAFTSLGTGDMDLNVYEAWELVPASSTEVVIGLIDTGIDYRHPDLKEKVWLNPGEALHIDGNNNGIDDGCEDGVDLDNNGYLDDCHGVNTQVERFLEQNPQQLNPLAGDPMDSATGHGTNMAGIIGAVGDNAGSDFHGGIAGITGMHANIRIATCAAAELQFDAYVTIPGLGGAYGTREDILECFAYFLDLKLRGVNVVVINGSGGASQFNNLNNIIIPRGLVNEKYLLNTPEVADAVTRLEQADINLVVAAGNNSWDIDLNSENAYYPAAFTHDNVIAVGAIDNQGKPWRYSSYGRWSVDVFAPGKSILSTSPREMITGSAETADYVVSDGTSQATAFVSGMIALARSYPATADLSAADLRRLIVSSGKPLADIDDKSVSGKLTRLVDNNNTGFLNCQNQKFQRRQWPQQNVVQLLPDEWFELKVANYNCDQPAMVSSLVATIHPSGETFALHDDGVFPDDRANDGVYSGQWQASAAYDRYEITWGMDSVTGQMDSVQVNTTIIVDNQDRNTERTGSWWPSIYRPAFLGNNYRYAHASGQRRFTWQPIVPRAGYYEVLAHWPKYSGFTQHAEYTIHHGENTNLNSTLVVADQSQNGGQWNSLGVFWFDEGSFPVELSNNNITGIVIADAVKLRPVMP